ncbi:acyl-CoA synthetase [Phanerochaete sordida]|uniref:Acyl-CoA synthetase n=1 Tax=Phanerochaete sordida TaxID=48140 RepID=A0A9P3G1K6_9APHY|nr:acyl-CoA synthetase [Phanerochaete sordida]
MLLLPKRVPARVLARRSYAKLTQSYVEGPTDPPLSHLTLPAYFAQHILPHHADRPALVCRAEKPDALGGPPQTSTAAHLAWTFRELDDHVSALARGLLALGVTKGERVGVIMGNNSAYALLQWACARVGARLVTLNPAYRAPELVATLALAQVNHLVVVPRIRTSAYLRILADALPSLAAAAPGQVRDERLPELRNVVVVDDLGGDEGAAERARVRAAVDFREILVWRDAGPEQRELEALERGLKEHEIINLQFTSGTTGAPKAVSLTHHNLLNNGLQIGRCMRLTPSDVLCNVPPLFHCFGLVLGNLAAWTHGSSVVYPAPVFSAAAVVDALLAERASALHGVPTHFLGVLAEVERREQERGTKLVFDRLRTGIAAGSSIPIPLMRTLVDKLNLTELTIAYGMTETSPVSFQTTPNDPLEKRVETVGRVHPHVKAKIILTDRAHATDDAHGGEHAIAPVGTPGELLVAGYLLQAGYWKDAAHTAQAMRRDAAGTLWMHTGDEGVLDADGYLRIVGRIKDLIIRGGENLFPVQIENALGAHAGVREAAAVAVPDARLGEAVGAWVVRAPGPAGAALSPADVREAVVRGMNPQNAPAYVWFVGELGEYAQGKEGEEEEGGVRKFAGLPKTASGKVMKHVLRRWARELAERGVGRVG